MVLADYINKKPSIMTKRLIIRPMTIADVPDLKEWMPDKSIYTYWGKNPSKTDKNAELLFQKETRSKKSFYLGIALKDLNKIIGDLWIYLIENNRMACVALRISKKYQNQKYGTESLSAITKFCFENTELKRLWAKIDVRNLASQKIFKKCGYIQEGLIRQGKMVNTWCDYFVYGILDSDYFNKKN